jgi:drug/metabolite transporter (DMT)-like permease
MSDLIAGALLISFAPVIVRLLTVSSAVAGFYRMAFGLVLLLLWTLPRRRPLLTERRPLQMALLAGICFSVDILCWQRAIHLIGPGLATLLANCQIFFVILFGWIFLRERPAARTLAAVPLALAGLTLVAGPTWSGTATAQVGILLGALAALSYALYLLILRQAERDQARIEGASPIMIWNTLGSLLILWPAVLWEGSSLIPPSATQMGLLALYGILVQGLAWMLISRGLARMPVALGSLILLIQTAMALIWDGLFFGRPFSVIEGAGALLTLVAIYLGATGRPAVEAPPPQPTPENL